ncbi:MAG: hypothetical protein GY719_12115 [bacterium]|nr:hypothetical protein [bacterium]
MSTKRSPIPWSRRLQTMAVLVAVLATPGSLGAQQEVDSSTADALGAPTIDPFMTSPVLQAHKLRGLTAEVASLVLRGEVGGDIAFEALATPLRGEGGKAHVPFFVEIDGPTFLESNQSSTARVEIYAYALGADQGVAGYLAEVFVVDVQKLGEAIWQSGLKYYGHLELPPGRYNLRLAIRHYQSGASALREIELEVPAFDEAPGPVLPPPIFAPPAARDVWLPVREWAHAAQYPFLADGRAISPAVRPVLVAGRPAQANLFGYGLPAGDLRGKVQFLQGGVPVAGTQMRLERLGAATGGDLEAFEMFFDSPPIEPGIYALRVEIDGGAATTPTPVVVLQASTRDRGLLWTDLRGQLNKGAAHSQPAATAAAVPDTEKEMSRAERREDKKRVRELASRYRSTLSTLGQGNWPAARSALLDLESSILTDGSLQQLRAAQLLVSEKLAQSDVECLIPVLVLHGELYRAYRQRNLFSLGSNSRAVIELLAELYAERGGTEGSRIVAARALASLAGYLQEANLPSNSRRLYERALAHDPSNTAALLGLATSYERYAEYSLAIESLERLVAAHPDSGEGLLRLSINLDRVGLKPRARDLVSRVIEIEAPDWIRSLAYQRLARAMVDTGDLEQAAQLLERSLDENTDQHGSIYLLAHIYDRQRDAYKALALLQEKPSANGSGTTERKRYDSWPEASLEAMREQLIEAGKVRAPLIAKILQRETGP